MTEHIKAWKWETLEKGLAEILQIPEIKDSIGEEHVKDTPQRVCKMYQELFAGCFEDPKKVLERQFDERQYDEMIYVNDVKFVSVCAHHLAPFMGRVHFAYIPNKHIVGLSKIPRLVEIFARRPQVQENLTEDIVGTFYDVVHPQGCGVVIEATHMCMAIRGIKKEDAYMKTTALRGNFTEATVRAEFLDGIKKVRNGSIWP